MKILITGFTNRMCRPESANKLYRSQGVMLYDELLAMGHDAEMRAVSCDESLDDYDLAFVGIHPLSSITSGRFVEAAYAIHKLHDRCILYVEDWSIQRLGADWRGKLSSGAWQKHLAWQKRQGDATTDSARATLHMVLERGFPLLAFMLNWGSHDLLLKHADIYFRLETLDPSPIVRMPKIESRGKQRMWALATLGDHRNWLKRLHLRWPVYECGRADQPKIPEDQVVQLYANCWGVLSPEYRLAGSGWWRVRFNYAPQVGSILHCGQIDGHAMHESYCRDPAIVESLSDSQLEALAGMQATWYHATAWTLERFRDELTSILRRYGRSGSGGPGAGVTWAGQARAEIEVPGDSPASSDLY